MWNNLCEWNFKITRRNLIVIWNRKCCHRFNFQGNFCCMKESGIFVDFLFEYFFFAMVIKFLLCFSFTEGWRRSSQKNHRKNWWLLKKSEKEGVCVENCFLLKIFIYTAEWLKYTSFFQYLSSPTPLPPLYSHFISEIYSKADNVFSFFSFFLFLIGSLFVLQFFSFPFP